MNNTNSNYDFWNTINNNTKVFEGNLDKLFRKRTGSYYTDLQLTDVMMRELVLTMQNDEIDIVRQKFLEPCVGTGNFVFSYIKAVDELGISNEDAEILLDNIYVNDINEDSLNTYKCMLKDVASNLWSITLTDEYFATHMGQGLLIDVTKPKLNYVDINDVFPDIIKNGGFDIIATNPPYKNLKAERSHYPNEEEFSKDREKYSIISQIALEKFKYSTKGVLNLYKLFVEEIVDKYANSTAYISLLIPSSILSDKTSEKLRTHMLIDSSIISIKNIDEESEYVDAQQSLSAILLHKGEKTSEIIITNDYGRDSAESINVQIEDIINENTGNSIFSLKESEYQMLRKMRKFPTIGELDFIINLRGELDLTANKSSIVNIDTGYMLLRGRNIGFYSLMNTGKLDGVETDFIKTTSKKNYIKGNRIACQQISNLKKERRVVFAFIEPNYVLGNSCNFISVLDNEYGIDIYTLLGLLNTRIINWFFKLTSSNNHINNYEIDSFPIPVHAEELKSISSITKKYLKNNSDIYLEQIEKLAESAYSL